MTATYATLILRGLAVLAVVAGPAPITHGRGGERRGSDMASPLSARVRPIAGDAAELVML